MSDPNAISALRRIEAYIATADAIEWTEVPVAVDDLRDAAVALRRAARDSSSTTERGPTDD